MKFPEEINRLISGRTFDLATAHNKYVALCELFQKRLGNNLKQQGKRYEVSPKFFAAFRGHLHQVIGQHFSHSWMSASDAVAIAMFRTCLLFRLPTGSKSKRVSRFRDLLNKFRQGSSGFRRLLRSLTWSSKDLFNTPYPNRRGLKEQGKEYDSPLEVSFTCEFVEDNEKPCLSLDLCGSSVKILAVPLFGKSKKSTRHSDWKRARRLWVSIYERLSVMTGVTNPKGGRPREHSVAEACFLKDMCGASWAEIASVLCEENHGHGRMCRERFRKAVEQHKRRIRRQASSSPASENR